MGERIDLARTRTGNHERRRGGYARVCLNAVFDRPSLLRIELFKVGGVHEVRISLGMDGSINHASRLAQRIRRTLFRQGMSGGMAPVDSIT
jgi:hypothetical protein